jgi:hypothetical protein
MAKLPSGRFPFINLSKALERAQQIFENDKNNKGLKMPVAFAAWGYSDKSSGGFQTVGALKQYGLLEDEGAKDDRSVKLTAEARHYFLTEIEEDKNRLRAKFASKPSLMNYLLEQWEFGTIDDAVARSHLKTVIHLNDQSARSALGVYKDNLAFLKVSGSAKKEPINQNGDHKPKPNPDLFRSAHVPETHVEVSEEAPKNVRVGDRVQATVNGMDQFDLPRVVTEVFRDAERGWFVSVQGEKGALPMEQVTVMDHGAGTKTQRDDADTGGEKKPNPIEIFMSSSNRLQITADIDRQGVDKLRSLLDKYAEILDLMS